MSGRTDSPAFPSAHGELAAMGLTKREYFAAMAMQGMVTACGIQFSRVDHADLVGHALHLADALIAALNAEPQS